MFGKEVKDLKRGTVAYCNSSDTGVTILLAFTQALQMLDMNAKGKVVSFSLEQEIARG